MSLFPHAFYPLPFPISFAQSPYRSLISLIASWIFPVFTLHKWTDTCVLSYVPMFIKWTAFSHASLPFSFCTKQHSIKKTLYSLEGFFLFYSFIGLHWPLYGHFNCFQHFVIINTKNAAGNNLGIIFMLMEMYLQVFLTEVGSKVKCIYSSIRYFQISHPKSCTGFHCHWPLGLFPQNLTIRTCCPIIVTFVDMVGEKWYLSVVLVCWGLVPQACLTLAIPWTGACQAPLSMGFSRQEYWNWLPIPSAGDLPQPGIEPEYLASPALQVNCLPLSHQGSPCFSLYLSNYEKVWHIILWGLFYIFFCELSVYTFSYSS